MARIRIRPAVGRRLLFLGAPWVIAAAFTALGAALKLPYGWLAELMAQEWVIIPNVAALATLSLLLFLDWLRPLPPRDPPDWIKYPALVFLCWNLAVILLIAVAATAYFMGRRYFPLLVQGAVLAMIGYFLVRVWSGALFGLYRRLR